MNPSLTTAVAAAQRQDALASAAASRRARQARRARRARRADVGLGRTSLLGARPVTMIPKPAAAAASPAGCQPSAALRSANWR
jgi:hypothetical protein